MAQLSQRAFDLAEEIGDALDHHDATLEMLQRTLCEIGFERREREVHTLLASLRLFTQSAAQAASEIARSGVE